MPYGGAGLTDFFDTCYASLMLQDRAIAETIRAVDESHSEQLRQGERIILMGCGDSYAVASYGRWCLLVAGIDSVHLSPSEIGYTPVDDGTLVIGVTASGRSVAVLDALRQAREQGAKIIVLTDNAEGAASKMADDVWVTRSGASTYDTSPSSPTTAAMAYLLTLTASIVETRQEEVRDDIGVLEHQGSEVMSWAKEEGRKMAEMVDVDHPVYVISEGANHAAAQIGMMKFNEYSLVRGIAAVREEFRHHYNLSVDVGDRAILITDSPPTDEDRVYLEVLSHTLRMSAYHLWTPVEIGLHTPPAQAIPNAIALQFAAYFSAVKWNPDKTSFKEPNASAFRIY